MSTEKQQKVTRLLMAAVGLLYFCLFLIPNSYGASNDEILLGASSDEYVTYPNVVRILTPGKTFFETRANLFLYEDYHYGYPFYALSALAVLPSRILYGMDFTNHMQLNLLLLRQLISVLPLILSAAIMVYLQTRFLSPLKSLALFAFLLTIRGVVRNHIWWWHPDALTVLAVVLTIFFLDRDQLRLGKNFYFASIACGLATAIKLLGFAFILTIPVYLMVGLVQCKYDVRKALVGSGLFVLLMFAVVIFSNPFLFSAQQRQRMIEIQAQKSEELSQGYEHDDPIYYSKGPKWWASILEKWYAPPWFLVLLTLSLVSGILWGEQKLLSLIVFTWVVPYSVYLLFFVAVKPDHYWLPVVLPLFSFALVPVNIISSRMKLARERIMSLPVSLGSVLLLIITILLAWQLVVNITRQDSGNAAIYSSAVERGIEQLHNIQR